MGAVLTVALVASVLWAWFCVFWLVPRNLRGMFRYRLWRLRDELADDIRSEEFERTDEPRRVLRAVECFIASADVLTPFRVGMILALAWPKRRMLEDGDQPLSLRGLSPDDKKRLGAYIKRFNTTVSHQIFVGSPSGWFLAIPAWLLAKVLRLIVRIRHQDGERNGTYDVQRRTTEVSFAALSASHIEPVDHHPLSQYVG